MAERVAYLRLLSGERVFARQRINTIALVSILIPAFDCYRLALAKPGAEEISVVDDGSSGRALAGARVNLS
jgi:hypothetical protein